MTSPYRDPPGGTLQIEPDLESMLHRLPALPRLVRVHPVRFWRFARETMAKIFPGGPDGGGERIDVATSLGSFSITSDPNVDEHTLRWEA